MQPSLFNFLEDEVGELDEEQKLLVRVAESLELRQIAARYGWCGNERKPSSRLAIFKLLLMKHVWNCPETKDALGEVLEVTGVGVSGTARGRFPQTSAKNPFSSETMSQ